jgi:hypothetical protein
MVVLEVRIEILVDRVAQSSMLSLISHIGTTIRTRGGAVGTTGVDLVTGAVISSALKRTVLDHGTGLLGTIKLHRRESVMFLMLEIILVVSVMGVRIDFMARSTYKAVFVDNLFIRRGRDVGGVRSGNLCGI